MFDINDPRPSPFDRKKKDGESSPAAAKSANLVDKWGNPPTMIDRAFGLKGFGPAKPEAIAPKPAGLKLPQELDDEAKARGRAYGAIGATGMVPQNPAGAPMPQPEKPFFNLNDPRPSPFAIGMQQPATAELPQPVAKVQQQPPGGVMVDRFGNQPSWLERKLGMTNGLRPEGTVPQATPIIDMPQLDPQQIADAQGRGRAYGAIQTANIGQPSQPPVPAPVATPQGFGYDPKRIAETSSPSAHINDYKNQVVSDTDRLESDKLVRGVMGKNANQNLQNINNDASVRDTMNKAWAMRGAGIQVQQGANGPMFSNSTGAEKMRYTGADGKATNNWSNTAEYKQGIDTAGRIKALADGMERQRYLDAGDGERLGAIDRMRQTDANIESAKATQGIAKQELGIRKETHDAQVQDRNELKNLEALHKAETDPAKRDALERQIRVVRGKDMQPRYKSHVIPAIKNADGSTSEGGVYVEDTHTGTGQWVNPGAQHGVPLPADPSQRKVGTVYTSPNGKPVKWDGKGVLPA